MVAAAQEALLKEKLNPRSDNCYRNSDEMEKQAQKLYPECCNAKHSSFKERSSNRGMCILSAFLLVACLAQAYWNYQLYDDLARVRHDVDAILESPCDFLCKDRSDYRETSENGNPAENDQETLIFDDELDIEETEVSSTSNNTVEESEVALYENHSMSVVRRSAGSATKPKSRRQLENQIRRLLRKNKAISIHVQAQRSESDPISGFNIPGRTLTGWQTPGRKYIGFDVNNLSSRGYFTVRASGLYYVYSQVIFLTTDVPHMIAEIGVKTMGATTFAKCQFSRSTDVRQTGSYVACHSNGIVYLRSGEGVSLVVNPPQVEVYMAPEYTYFGAFMIGL